MKKFFALICAVCLLMTGCGSDKPIEQPAQQQTAPVEEKTFYTNGQFKVGTDLPAGEYLAVGTGYVEVAKDSSGDVHSILVNDNIIDAQRYIVANDGEYVKVMNGLKLYLASNAPKLNTENGLPSGQYKAGVDIPAGEYKIDLEAGGYFAVTQDTRKAYVKNQFSNEGGSFYSTVANGQYLQIKKGTGQFVETTAENATPVVTEAKETLPPSAPVQQSAPAKFPDLGITVAQFKNAFAAAASSYGVPQFNINNAVYQQGSVQDMLEYKFSANVSLSCQVNKSNGLIRTANVTLIPLVDGDATIAFMAYEILVTMFNPELTQDERNALFDELCLTEDKILALQDSSPKAIRGNRKYSVVYVKPVDSVGIIYWSVSNSDDN